jgi:hypothetical protein
MSNKYYLKENMKIDKKKIKQAAIEKLNEGKSKQVTYNELGLAEKVSCWG